MSTINPLPEFSTKVSYISSGTPYITLPTSAKSPIYLTPFYPTDTTALQAIHSDVSLASDLLNLPQPYTLSDAESWINLQLSSSAAANLPLQTIRANHPDATGLLIGGAALVRLSSPILGPMAAKSQQENEYELGYYLDSQWRGKGIMAAAVRAVVEWGKELHGANAVIRVEEGNLKSRKVVERMEEWVRVEERDHWVDWPEIKGGGRRKFLFWKWKH